MNMFNISEAVVEVLNGFVTQSSTLGGANFKDTMIAIFNLATPIPLDFSFVPEFPQKSSNF